MRGTLDAFVGAAPWPQRPALRALVALAARPRGRALLRRVGPLHQLGTSLVAFARYDDPAVSRILGWDPERVVARGRELRRAEGRP